jgi:hypothetical protein
VGKDSDDTIKKRVQLLVKTRLIPILMIILFGYNFGRCQSSVESGGRAGAPFRLGFGARGIGMGNALTAVRSGDLNSYYNPALLPFESLPVVLLSYGSLSLDRKLNFVSYTQGLKPDAGISVGIINAGVSNIDGRDNDGVPAETYSTSENQFYLSFGLRPSTGLAFGVTAKVLYYSLFRNMKSTTAGLDVGILYFISSEITLGFVIQDVLSKYRWDSSKLYGVNGSSVDDKFPLRKRLGASYVSSDWGFIVSAEAEWIGSEGSSRLGAELELFSGFQIRAGVDQISFSGNLPSKPSVGFSVRTQIATWTPRFDYAYVSEPYGPSGMHFLTLSLSFQ